ncbi:hypothetical protein ACC761_06465 [Rhizobium ruizarguesonis]|nr:hypothetical protein [Rhizobium leguminosarum]
MKHSPWYVTAVLHGEYDVGNFWQRLWVAVGILTGRYVAAEAKQIKQ